MAEGFDVSSSSPDKLQNRDLESESDGMCDTIRANILTSEFGNVCTLEDRFEKLPIFNKPLCLIHTDEQGKLAVVENVLSQIRQIDVPLNVVSVCGLYRSGKSYLMNRLAGERSGFSLGRTTKSHTKGIWAWCKVHPKQNGQVLLLLDTEGLADIEKGDSNHDNHLFSLAILLSSTMIYNMIGVFNKEALEKLTFITQLSQEVQVIGNEVSNSTNHNLIRAISPFFILCLRDFFLDIDCENNDQPPSPDEYFENCLKEDKSGCDTYNRTRECITNFFPKRKCFTVAQPALGRKLKNLEATEDKELEQEFIRDVDEMRDFVYQQKHKTLDAVTKVPVNGIVFDKITTKYVQMLRKGLRLNYQDAFQQVAQHHNNNLLENLLADFDKDMDALKLPFGRKTELYERYCYHQSKLLEKFREEALPFCKEDFEKQALDKMQSKWIIIRAANSLEIQVVCEGALQVFYKDLIEVNRDQYRGKDGYEAYTRQMENLKKNYHEAMGSFDNDECMLAWSRFKSSKADENMKIYREATKQLDQSRYDEFKRDLEEKLKAEFQRQMQELALQKDINFKKQVQNMEDMLTAVIQEDMKRERTYENELAKLETLRSTPQKAMENVKEDSRCIVM